ncbi:MAG: ATP-binding protein [Desulfobulbaceae bacterium]|nr:ATP-binding protein [Desulfobulbaceae bacterium]
MKYLNQKFANFSSNFPKSPIQGRSYRRLRLTSLLAMVAVCMIPLTITTWLSYHQYRDHLWKEEKDQLYWKTEGSKKTVEAFVGELKAIVKFVAKDYTFQELLDQNTASNLFKRLKEEYKGFVDLGVIDENGIQRTYAGPYQLENYDYSEQLWYHHVLSRQVYISEVFMGYRQVPHFVIAVSSKMPEKEAYWVLRLTIDAATLQQFIATISTKPFQDIILVNHNGVIQTVSHSFGGVFESYPLFNQPYRGSLVVTEEKKGSSTILQATTYLANTPWILVILKEGTVYGSDWYSFRTRLGIIFFSSSIFSLVVIFQVVNVFIKRLRDADQKRQDIVAEVEHTNKLASIGRLATGVAHEINNPLAIIDQKIGLMKDLLDVTEEFGHKNKIVHSIHGVQSAINRCKLITHRLLGFARRMDVMLEYIDLNELLKEVLGFLEKEALYSHIRIELSLQEDLPKIYSDRGQLQQTFLNIINNAIDAIGQDGFIYLSSQIETENSVKVVIRDTGPGISPNVMKHIFDPFFTTKPAGKGTGLGLSITYGLVNKLGGKISVESELGKGSMFTIVLPVRSHTEEENADGNN